MLCFSLNVLNINAGHGSAGGVDVADEGGAGAAVGAAVLPQGPQVRPAG